MKALHIYLRFLIFLLLLTSCRNEETSVISNNLFTNFTEIQAITETDPVPGEAGTDAADDPAFWYNNDYPDSSLIFATNKKGGILVYNLCGTLKYYYKEGLPNNIDIRKNIVIGDTIIDIAGCSNREENSIDIYMISAHGELSLPLALRITPEFKGEVYGFCLYHDLSTGVVFAVVNSKNGEIELWALNSQNHNLTANFYKGFKVSSQPEGMVADDELNLLYIGEERKGIWKFDLIEGLNKPILISDGSIKKNKALKADIEGLAIYYKDNAQGYLIASSQGNNSYALFKRSGNNEYLGSFRILGPENDLTEETDGIEVTHLASGAKFKKGILIVQDGVNTNSDNSPIPQNFKIVSWEHLEDSLNLR